LLIRTDSIGNEIWNTTFFESDRGSNGYSVIQTADGSFIVTGMLDLGGSDSQIFLLRVNEYTLGVESEYGFVSGSGTYVQGSTVTLDISPLRVNSGLFIRKQFKEWSGDIVSTENLVSVIMDRSKSVRAEWITDYTQLYYIAGAILVIFTSIGLFKVRKQTVFNG